MTVIDVRKLIFGSTDFLFRGVCVNQIKYATIELASDSHYRISDALIPKKFKATNVRQLFEAEVF